MNGYGTTTFAWSAVTEGRGSIHATANSPTAVILGGDRDGASYSGSRASNWSYYVWYSSWAIGVRFACDSLKLV